MPDAPAGAAAVPDEPIVAQIPDTPATPPPDPNAPVKGEIAMDKPAVKKWAGKYETPEALETGYTELQKMASSKGIASFADLGAKVGINLDDAVVNYIADGKMNAEQEAAFEKAGIGKELAERLINGEASRIKLANFEVQKVKQDVAAVVGGETQRDTVLNWAAGTMLKPEIEAFNAKLNDPRTAVAAMREIAFLHQQAVGGGHARPLIQGMPAPAEASGFGSVNEVIAAMKMSRQQGYMDEATQRKLANTPQHFIEGYDS